MERIVERTAKQLRAAVEELGRTVPRELGWTGTAEQFWIVAGVATVGVLLAVAVGRRRRSSGLRRSKRAHEAAQRREPPVELGETYEFGVMEFTDHHSGNRVAVGKVEGFVLFTEDVPDSLSEGDVIRAKVLSFNRGRTSADARFVETT